ncbi:aldo/keto reductase [Clostridium oryzae]|uniref:Putative oxidoreductase YtbE n=1 Tax=Clostridium oryzae TaxID=1450648 RepID=A0A1V4ID93_9CLOT|nr:aldo/keto reductase [Clostridium oryzae]OPJ57978.1 putative oxidoreductase YtbE [Clostridium oryzae]
MPKNLQDTVTLYNGVKMPWLGLGVFKVPNGETVINSVKTAIKYGYRSIDGAAAYDNEEGMGKGITEGIKEAGIKREDLFITSKVWNSDLRAGTTKKAFESTLKKLGLDYLDLYLIHWPVKGKYKEAWKVLESLYKEKRIRAIGVSNFQVHHLKDLMQDAEIKPMVNQVEYHPRLTQLEVKPFCEENEIQLEAWSPLMQGRLLDNGIINKLASKYNKTAAQIILRWDLQTGVVTIPKSTKEKRIIENASIFDFELSVEDLAEISSLNRNKRVGSDPDTFKF